MKAETKEMISFENCPKCGAEIQKIQYRDVLIERCPNCKGLFVDYKELRRPAVRAFIDEEAVKRPDAKELDRIKITCPKCGIKMTKKRGAVKKRFILDTCPECNGVWFDEGELKKYGGLKWRLLHHPVKMCVKLFCPACRVNVEYDPLREDPTKCTLCGGWLDFEGAGEVLVPRLQRKDALAIRLFLILVPILFIITYIAFKSFFAAALFTGTLGIGIIYIFIRAAVYNRLAWASSTRGFGIVCDFPLSQTGEDE